MKKLQYIFLGLLILSACETQNPVPMELGPEKDDAQLESLPSISFHATASTDNIVSINLPEGGNFTSVSVYARANRPLEMSQSIQITVDETLVEKYNATHKTEATLLPTAFYIIEDGGVITIPYGSTQSADKLVRIYATNPLGNVLAAGDYLLPLADHSGGVVYVEVSIQAAFTGRPPLYEGEDCFTVFYLNTSQFDPRLVTDFVASRFSPSHERLWHNAIGNIVNFRSVTVGYDEASGRALLCPSADMRFLCDNFNTYFKPVKDTGRKLCICIEGGGKGIGFCNMTDEQIADFVQQVSVFINEYGFDGVNLWDRNSGYGKDGFSPINTTSYPKLIKALREELGPYRLLTVVDYKEPTEYFWNIEAMGGIEVGKYMDYAWSGYASGEEPIQIVDPYHQGEYPVSTIYPRNPITGLSPKRYGPVYTAWYAADKVMICGYETVSEWVSKGMKQSNISVYYDIRSNLQDKYEGGLFIPVELLQFLDETNLLGPTEQYTYGFDLQNFNTGGSGYGKWLKDW